MRTHYEPFVLLVPGVVVLLVAFFVPIGYLCSYSFLVEQIDGTTKLGFGQYLRFFTDSYFWSVSERTLRLSLIITALCLILGAVMTGYSVMFGWQGDGVYLCNRGGVECSDGACTLLALAICSMT